MPNVRFVGFQPEGKLNQLVNLADVHVLPQRAGAADLVMPSKLTTMLASGKPVIACAAPGTQLWKVVTQVGLTVMPECAEELASAIMALLNNPAECARLGKLGREYACEHLEKEVILGKFMADLHALLDGREQQVWSTN
jgi:colanic acid biosynthesis glycosyl transferase WcaI